MSSNDYGYMINVQNMMKGRIAEALIEELFLKLGYSVYRYGMENTIPGVMSHLTTLIDDNTKNQIQRMPDFVVQSPSKDKVFFVEVKFRKNETFSIENVRKDYPYTNCYFIVVSKKHIKCVTYEQLLSGREVTPRSQNYLANMYDFQLKEDKDMIIAFCELAKELFKWVG